jgi:hypothetical protein
MPELSGHAACFADPPQRYRRRRGKAFPVDHNLPAADQRRQEIPGEVDAMRLPARRLGSMLSEHAERQR